MDEILRPVQDALFLSDFLSEELFLTKSDKEALAGTFHETGAAGPSTQVLRGDYNKKVLLVTGEEYVEDSDQSSLVNNILEAIKLSWQDVMLLQVGGETDLNELEAQYLPRLLVWFGDTTNVKNWPREAQLGQLYANGKNYYLPTRSLSALVGARDDKLKLWKVLKSLFKI